MRTNRRQQIISAAISRTKLKLKRLFLRMMKASMVTLEIPLPLGWRCPVCNMRNHGAMDGCGYCGELRDYA